MTMKLWLVNASAYSDTHYIVRALTAERAIELVQQFYPYFRDPQWTAQELPVDGAEGVISDPPDVFESPK